MERRQHVVCLRDTFTRGECKRTVTTQTAMVHEADASRRSGENNKWVQRVGFLCGNIAAYVYVRHPARGEGPAIESLKLN